MPCWTFVSNTAEAKTVNQKQQEEGYDLTLTSLLNYVDVNKPQLPFYSNFRCFIILISTSLEPLI